MDRRFLRYYEEELRFLRDMGGEFAASHPGVASKLGLDAFACADPYVERLLEGVAFLTARVQLKMDAEFPKFVDNLLELVYPDYLTPTPAMLIAHLAPNLSVGTLVEGPKVPRGTYLHSVLGEKMQTRCTFRTAHDVTLWPIEIKSVDYLTSSNLTSRGLARRGRVNAALKIELATSGDIPFESLSLETLSLHLRSGPSAYRLYEAIIGHCRGVVVLPPNGEGDWRHEADASHVKREGFADDQALLPDTPLGFDGHRLVREYFAFPARFRFVEIGGLGGGVRRCAGKRLEIYLLFDRVSAELQGSLSSDDVSLYCTPAINLHERACEPVTLDHADRHHHVLVDRARPMDFEVHSLVSVTGDREGKGSSQEFTPFYGAQGGMASSEEKSWYTIERRPRLSASKYEYQAKSADERRSSAKDTRRRAPRSSYLGSEIFIAIVDAEHPPWPSDLKRLHVRATCTNRDLPMHMLLKGGRGTDFTTDVGAPISGITCIEGPTVPRPSLAHGEPSTARPDSLHGEAGWRLINQLSLNYTSIVDGPGEEGSATLRDFLRLYADFSDPAVESRQVEGVRSVTSRPVVDRLPGSGPITFGRGLEVNLKFEESFFEGGSAFVLGAVIEQYLRRQVSINSFVRTNVETIERGEIMRWPARIGQRHLL